MRFPYKAYADMMKAEREESAISTRDAKMSAAERKQVIEESAIEDDDEEFASEETDEPEDNSVD